MKKQHAAAGYVTQFDSSTSMLYGLSHALNRTAFKGVGVVPSQLEFVPALLNFLPFNLRQSIYRASGGWAAIPPSKLRLVNSEEISEWVVSQYPARRYPAIMIGSSNGAMTHLAAALGIPWLPQTFLLAVRREVDPDEIEADMEWGKEAARTVRRRNPDLKMNQMHDPVQDRLMVAKMAYFRIKRLRLGGAYERFIRERLKPGGTLLIIDNNLPWPMTNVGEQHTFQIGGLGALDPYEYLNGSPRVGAFLKKHGSSRKKWSLPGTVFEAPESEWGFEPDLGQDVRRVADRDGYAVRQAAFEDPESASFFVADLYRWWYLRRRIPAERLFVECFAMIEPWVTLRSHLVPFWLAFNTEPSLRALRAYVGGGKEFAEIYLMLMSNGVEGIGQVPIGAWKKILEHARDKGEFLGVDENKYPMDFASFVRYHRDLKKKIPAGNGDPPEMKLSEMEEFIEFSSGKYKIHWK